MLNGLFLFANRVDAGEQLATRLLEEPSVQARAAEKLLVLSVPRGGVAVGATVARLLGCAHEVIAVRKISFPGHQEMAIGALAEEGTLVLSPYVRIEFNNYIDRALERVKVKIEAAVQRFRQGRALDVAAKTVIVVDDGIATGETMKAAVTWLRARDSSQRPERIVVAVPVCAPRAAGEFEHLADKFVCLVVPQRFWAVGQFYWNFDQVSDEQVLAYLSPPATAGSKTGTATEKMALD